MDGPHASPGVRSGRALRYTLPGAPLRCESIAAWAGRLSSVVRSLRRVGHALCGGQARRRRGRGRGHG